MKLFEAQDYIDSDAKILPVAKAMIATLPLASMTILSGRYAFRYQKGLLNYHEQHCDGELEGEYCTNKAQRDPENRNFSINN